MREKRTARYTGINREGREGKDGKNLAGSKNGKDIWKTGKHYEGN
jgi:hypothetical protein